MLAIRYNVKSAMSTSLGKYNRYLKSQKHIKNANIKFKEFNDLQQWANNNNIYDYEKLTRHQLKESRSLCNNIKSITVYITKQS